MIVQVNDAYPIKGANHYIQLVQSKKFRRFDYGIRGNLIEYGAPEPPDYELKNINVPNLIYRGQNDFVANKEVSLFYPFIVI